MGEMYRTLPEDEGTTVREPPARKTPKLLDSFENLIQEGNVGVMKAVDKFPSNLAQELKTPERVRALRRELVGDFDSVEDFRRRIASQTVLPFTGMWHVYAGRGALGC